MANVSGQTLCNRLRVITRCLRDNADTLNRTTTTEDFVALLSDLEVDLESALKITRELQARHQ